MGRFDDAATCVVAYQYKAKCAKDAKEELCLLICCCNKFPVQGKKNKLKQLCVDGLMKAKETEKRGILPGVPFDMRRDPPQTFGGMNAWGDGKYLATIAKCVKIVKGEDGDDSYVARTVRVPDVVVLKKADEPVMQSNIDKIYEIKFPGDRWGKNQRADYEKIASSDPDPDIRREKVEELNDKECGCKEKDDNKELEKEPVNEAVRQNALDMSQAADGALQRFIQQTKDYSDMLDVATLQNEFPELTRPAEAADDGSILQKITPSPETVQAIGKGVLAAIVILGAIALAPVGI